MADNNHDKPVSRFTKTVAALSFAGLGGVAVNNALTSEPPEAKVAKPEHTHTIEAVPAINTMATVREEAAPAEKPLATITATAAPQPHKDEITRLWAEITAGAEDSMAYKKLYEIGYLLRDPNRKPHDDLAKLSAAAVKADGYDLKELTDSELAAVGIKRSEFMAKLSRTAFAASQEQADIALSSPPSRAGYEAIYAMNQLTSDWEYGKGDPVKALTAFCQMSQKCCYDTLRAMNAEHAQVAATEYGTQFSQNGFPALPSLDFQTPLATFDRINTAIRDAGQNPEAEGVMDRYVGKSYKDFYRQTLDAQKQYDVSSSSTQRVSSTGNWQQKIASAKNDGHTLS